MLQASIPAPLRNQALIMLLFCQALQPSEFAGYAGVTLILRLTIKVSEGVATPTALQRRFIDLRQVCYQTT